MAEQSVNGWVGFWNDVIATPKAMLGHACH